MEQNKEYNAVKDVIGKLEQQRTSIEQGQDLSIVRREVEDHFERCIHSLEVRRDTLLTQLDEIAERQEQLMQDVMEQIQEAIQNCTEVMRSGSMVYKKNKATAENVWQAAREFELPNVGQELMHMRVEVTLPSELLDWIDNHGKVNLQDTTPAIGSSSELQTPEVTIPSASDAASTSNTASDIPSTVPPTPTATSTSPSTIQSINTAIDPASSQSCRFATAEMVTTLAGSGEEGFKDGKGPKASFQRPHGICINQRDGCLYVCDGENNAIRRVSMQGDVTTFMYQNKLERAFLASEKTLNDPSEIVMNHEENVFFVANHNNHTILKITSSGTVSVFAGSGQLGGDDGVGRKASFCYPHGLATDQATGTLFVSDSNTRIRKITRGGEVTTLAGSWRSGYADAKGSAAMFYSLQGICYDATSQSLIVCDKDNNKLRRVQLNGDVSTLCEVPEPEGIVMTANKTILVSAVKDIYKVIQKGPESYEVTVLAGCGKRGREDGTAAECSFDYPHGLVVDESTHSCYVAEYGNHVIRKISFAD